MNKFYVNRLGTVQRSTLYSCISHLGSSCWVFNDDTYDKVVKVLQCSMETSRLKARTSYSNVGVCTLKSFPIVRVRPIIMFANFEQLCNISRSPAGGGGVCDHSYGNAPATVRLDASGSP